MTVIGMLQQPPQYDGIVFPVSLTLVVYFPLHSHTAGNGYRSGNGAGVSHGPATVVIRCDEKGGLRTGCGVRSQVIDVLEAQIKRRPTMKKVSTTVAKQSRNISQQKLTIGLDLGDLNSWYCVVDEAGQVQLEQRVRTNAKALREVFGALPRSRIALEIGTHSPWISRLLSELGHEVIVANARKVRLIGESRKKDDRLDAETLARLARIDPELLYPVKHRSVQAQADLTLIRARAGLVRHEPGWSTRRADWRRVTGNACAASTCAT
jgi:Transposase